MANSSMTQVFGTPPEPLFNHKLCGLPPDMLENWISLLLKKNAQEVESAQPVKGSSITKDSVQFLFLTCERLKMSGEVKYLALELFDGFILKHVEDLHGHVLKSASIKTRAKDWQDIKHRVSNQVILRIISCIQIASKLTSHYRILSPHKARRLLLEMGHKYNIDSIIQSELRVLKTLNFFVSKQSPLVYLETLLEILGQKDIGLEVKVLHGVTQHLLDMVYLRYDTVYTGIQQLATGGSPITQTEKDNFACVRADKMLLMVTLITTATYVVDRFNHEKVMHMLSRITNIPTEDIADFSSVILKTLTSSCDKTAQECSQDTEK